MSAFRLRFLGATAFSQLWKSKFVRLRLQRIVGGDTLTRFSQTRRSQQNEQILFSHDRGMESMYVSKIKELVGEATKATPSIKEGLRS